MFSKMPFILIAIIVLTALFGQFIPPYYQSLLFAMSLSIKTMIVAILPLVIFGLLFKTAINFANKASKMILIILATVCLSNFSSTFISYGFGNIAYFFDLSIHFPDAESALLPTWEFSLPKWIGNDKAMFLGLVAGIVLGRWKPIVANKISNAFEKIVNGILKAILAVIPLFIAGFVVKMNHDQIMPYILKNYSLILLLIASALFTYISLIYLAVNQFNIKRTIQCFKNLIPAGIAGFGSMSSAAAMPLTIIGVEKNSKDPEFGRSIVPVTVNIHLMGDCFSICIFAFAVMKSFGFAAPSFISYLVFAAYFVLAKFSVAAVPGGGILVMLPILESYLGFNGEMLSLMTALYILFDPIITCANIYGNGGVAMILDRLFGKATSEKPIEQPLVIEPVSNS